MAQLLKNFLTFMEPECSLPRSQENVINFNTETSVRIILGIIHRVSCIDRRFPSNKNCVNANKLTYLEGITFPRKCVLLLKLFLLL